MGTLWELWAEISNESESLADPVLLECLQAGQTHRIFDDISNDSLKTVLSMINTLLNDPKNREKGVTIFNELILSVNTSRLVGFQDALISSLHLICKNMGSHMARNALANFLPRCKDLPDVNLVVTSSVVGKVVSRCIEEFQDKDGRQPGQEVVKLLKVCLERYRGPCGSFRDKLEKVLIPYMDHENCDLVRLICDILPLLSSTGGGGSQGDKHSKDWSTMIMRLMKSAYDCLHQLYSDACPMLEEENPFERGYPALSLPAILQPKVLLRISLLKRRLTNMISAICSYLRNPLPAPKPVPSRNILMLISQLIVVNPIDLLKNARGSSRKEVVFLSALLPSIHTIGFQLLNDLILCIGSNVLPDASSVEQIYSQVWKWIDVKNKAFENLKLEMFSSLQRWLSISHGNVTNVKTLKMWIDFLSKDIQLEKETVELKFTPKSKKEKKQFRAHALSMLNSTTANTFIFKNASVSEAALVIIKLLIPSLDVAIHKGIYQLLGKIHLQVYQSLSFPSPYDSYQCRQKLNQCLLELVVNPNPRSNVSVGLVINLLKRSFQDPVSSVSTFCQNGVSILERIVHPVSLSLSFPSLDLVSAPIRVSAVAVGNFGEIQMDEDAQKELEEEDSIETTDTGCQTERVEDNNSSENLEDDADNCSEEDTHSELKQIMSELRVLREELSDIRAVKSSDGVGVANLNSNVFSNGLSISKRPSFPSMSLEPFELTNGNGIHLDGYSNGKRHGVDTDEELEAHFEASAKRMRTNDSVIDELEQINGSEHGHEDKDVSEDLSLMMKDFVDVTPDQEALAI